MLEEESLITPETLGEVRSSVDMPKVEPILSNTVSRLDCVEENVFLEIVGTFWIGHLLEETRVSIS